MIARTIWGDETRNTMLLALDAHRAMDHGLHSANAQWPSGESHVRRYPSTAVEAAVLLRHHQWWQAGLRKTVLFSVPSNPCLRTCRPAPYP